MIHLIAAVCMFAYTTFIFWVAGFDFNERGSTAVSWVVFSTIAAMLGAWLWSLYKDTK